MLLPFHVCIFYSKYIQQFVCIHPSCDVEERQNTEYPVYIFCRCVRLMLCSANLCANLYYWAMIEKVGFYLPYQLSMLLVVKTAWNHSEFHHVKTVPRGTKSGPQDHLGDDRYNIWINILNQSLRFQSSFFFKKKNKEKAVQLHLISCCHILKPCQWKCHSGTALNAHATLVCVLEHKTSLHRHRMENFSKRPWKITHTGFMRNYISEKKQPVMWRISLCGNTLPNRQAFSQ